MAVSNKIKSMLELKELSKAGLAAHLQINEQSLRNKFIRNSFSADDLIKTAEYLGIELAFIFDFPQRYTLTTDDLQVKDKKQK
jgi:lambda repressor-like predicted transcriptional regulator